MKEIAKCIMIILLGLVVCYFGIQAFAYVLEMPFKMGNEIVEKHFNTCYMTYKIEDNKIVYTGGIIIGTDEGNKNLSAIKQDNLNLKFVPSEFGKIGELKFDSSQKGYIGITNTNTYKEVVKVYKGEKVKIEERELIAEVEIPVGETLEYIELTKGLDLGNYKGLISVVLVDDNGVEIPEVNFIEITINVE